jgi:lipopolysaccharide transport system permease protein
MFVSPVVYPVAPLVPENWRTLYFLNPLAGIIEGFRSALLGRELNLYGLAVSSVATIGLFFISSLVFRRIEKSFADVI